VSALCGLGSLWMLVRGTRRIARPIAMLAVATVVIGWGVAQWPYILPTSLRVSDAAAPDGTLGAMLLVFVLAALLILPSLAWLYSLDQRSALGAEGAASQ